MTVLYRYIDTTTSRGYGFMLQRYHILRETPCGYWFVHLYEKTFSTEHKELSKRWVSKSSRRRFCYPTKEEAWQSYRARKWHHLARLDEQIKNIRAVVNVIEHQQNPPTAECVTCRELQMEILF